ncbi:histone deacetylase family protein [Haloplanus halobius]|uniref:histone deacetylase family protein n=1 Tax=Haloplanus halobius TaxID=2934938 RepID=UPI00200C10C1|nr:histone deacetylase [Haloplanus sp. XH21]
MQFGYSEACLDHDTGDRHPETADRLRAIRKQLSRRHGVDYVATDPASVDALTSVHDANYVTDVREFCANGGGNWDPDTVASGATWTAARTSVGLAQWVAERALAGDDGRETPFSIGRPPGHHALADDAMGFCFFNNVAVAARTVIDSGDADRVAIFDWDVHHGNGTQEICYDQDDVFYASIHEEGLFPGTGAVEETGTGAGEGTTLNIPLASGAGDDDYLTAVETVIGPAIERFGPDLVLVSAGFDAHRHDPISRMRVSTEGYANLTDQLRETAEAVGAGLGFVLEGGYSLDTLSESIATIHETFDGRVPVDDRGDPTDATQDLLDDVRAIHGL